MTAIMLQKDKRLKIANFEQFFKQKKDAQSFNGGTKWGNGCSLITRRF